MQFYTLDIDPKISAKLLPDYALKRVNLREGYQMLSDIGHVVNVGWHKMNKEYNPYHALTRRFWESRGAFNFFIDHYQEYLSEYYRRFKKETFFHERFPLVLMLMKLLSNNVPDIFYLDNHFLGKCIQDGKYLLEKKLKFLSQDEVEKLKRKIERG